MDSKNVSEKFLHRHSFHSKKKTSFKNTIYGSKFFFPGIFFFRHPSKSCSVFYILEAKSFFRKDQKKNFNIFIFFESFAIWIGQIQSKLLYEHWTSNVKIFSHLQMDIFCHFNLYHCRRNTLGTFIYHGIF